MTVIGLTQRVSVIEEYEERRDCLDQRWAPLLQSYGATPVPLVNSVEAVEEYLTSLSLDRLVLTGGGDVPGYGQEEAHERARLERRVLETAVDNRLPVLGVCRGFQRLNQFFGGDLIEVDDHVGQPHPVTLDDPELDSAETAGPINSYHHFGISERTLAEPLRPCGYAPDGTIEFARHRSLPISGLMWHPEREAPADSLSPRLLTAFCQEGQV